MGLEGERELNPGERSLPAAAPASGPRAHALLALQGTAGNTAVARAVLARRPVAFPHEARIASALPSSLPLTGVHDPRACAERETPAFTDGTVTHFASESPDLHVAAHEAVHQLQHAGLTRDAGLGAERHANAVADAIVAGRPAEALIGPDGEHVAPARRNYTTTDGRGEWDPSKKKDGSGRLADTGETWTKATHEAFAVEGLMTKANDILKSRQSGVELSAGGESMSVQAPDGSGAKTLRSVVTKIAAGDNVTMSGDCRESAEEIMGPKGTHERTTVPSTPGGVRSEFNVDKESAGAMIAKTIYVDKRVQETPGFAQMSQEQKDAVLAKARSDYDGLGVEEKQKLRESPVAAARAKELGIDDFAKPAVGEAYVVIPGKHDPKGYMYHYAAVIMAPGEDRVTMENEGTNPGVRNTNWRIDTYGPASKDQSFNQYWAALRGPTGHTVTVRAGAPPTDYVAQIPGMTTQELLGRLAAAAGLEEREFLTQELGKRFIQIAVTVDKQQDFFGNDDVYAVVTGGGKPYKSERASIHEGASGTLSVPVASVLPIGASLAFEMKEYDLIDADDSIGTFTWDAPYAPLPVRKVTGDGATYSVSVSLSGPAAAPAAAPPPP